LARLHERIGISESGDEVASATESVVPR
jgi:hypothetical protein